MADPERAHEPSMEEILASIRRIISDDGEPPPQRDEADNDEAEAEAEAVSDEKFSREFEPEDDPEEEAEAEARPAADPEEEVADEPVEDDPPAENADSDDDEGEVFELTEVVAEEAEAATEDGDDIYHAAEVAFAKAAEEPDPPAPAAPRPREAYAGPLMSESAEASTAAAFGALTGQLRSRSGGGRTLEEIAEDLLRPMLHAWLDENLPPLVEQLVREEIERLSRRAK